MVRDEYPRKIEYLMDTQGMTEDEASYIVNAEYGDQPISVWYL